MSSRKGDLDGILVVSLEQAVAAPYASGRLADAGARVIKIERPEGDFARKYDDDAIGHSSYFVWLNRGKESAVLDLKQAADLELLKNMLARADIFIQNLMPGALDRLGLSIEALQGNHPALISCSISGYGSDGPFARMKAYDFLVQAEVGLANITGAPEAAGRVGVSICDIAAGMTAHQAILQALYARSRTGAGRHIEVSLFHALSDWMNVPYIQSHYGGKEIRRPGLHHPTIAPYGAYGCKDGKMILLSIQNEREWARLADQVFGRPDMIEDPRFASLIKRVENRAALDEIVCAHFLGRDRESAAAELAAADIAYGRLNSMDEFARHPQNRFISVRAGDAELQLLAPGAVVAGHSPQYGPVPSLGADSEKIREEFSG